MPTVEESTRKQRFSETVDTQSSRRAAAVGDRVLSTVTPTPSTGNTVDDHLEDIQARLSHPTDTADFKGVYNPWGPGGTSGTPTDYAVGNEVYWIDGSSRKVFFKRLTAGNDGGTGTPVTNASHWTEITNDLHEVPIIGAGTGDSVLMQTAAGAIQFNRHIITLINGSQSAVQVLAAINAEITKLVSTSRWRGHWAAGSHIIYEINDYVYGSNGTDIYRRHDHRGHDASNEDPANNATDWVEVTGLERLVAVRLRDISDLDAQAIELTKSAADRGRWIHRNPGDEGHSYAVPPLCWGDAWNDTSRYFYGNVVTNGNRLWVLTPVATITTPKHGAGTAPGTDTDWEEIAIGSGHVNWRGSWSEIAQGTAIRVGDVVEHTGFYYICEIAHNRTGSGPDAQPDNWTVLNNWGGTWSNRNYHSGVFVTHAERVWVSEADVNPDEPAPGASNNTKWVEVGSTRVNPKGDFNVSPTIGRDSQSRAVLESPGATGLWAEPLDIPAGPAGGQRHPARLGQAVCKWGGKQAAYPQPLVRAQPVSVAHRIGRRTHVQRGPRMN